MSRSRAYCFTTNNYSDDDISTLLAIDCRYLIFGRETAPDTGTPHLQGYIYFANAKHFNSVKSLLPKGSHIETARGSPDHNIEYCSKSGNFQEKGERPLSQKRKGELEIERYAKARAAAQSGSWDDIPADIYIRHYSSLKKIYAEAQIVPPSMENLDFQWYYGPTGTGKSRTAREKYPNHYLKLPNKWWDGYTGQDTVIIDEWDPSMEKYLGSALKRWCDHHAFNAEIKGGTICIRPPRIIVTSNYSLEECFQDTQNLEPLQRRFKTTHFKCLQL